MYRQQSYSTLSISLVIPGQKRILWLGVVAFKVISPTPRAFPEEVGKGEKGDFRRGTVAILVLAASYLNKSIKTHICVVVYLLQLTTKWQEPYNNKKKAKTKCLSRNLLSRMFSTQAYTRGTLIRLLTTTSKPGKYLMMLLVSENSKKMLLNSSNSNTKPKFSECVFSKASG